jgi:hypothetical protein
MLSISLAGCQEVTSKLRASQVEQDIYLPPTSASTQVNAQTLAQSPTVTPPAAAIEFQASPTPQCTNNLRFITDLTVPDGTQVAPGSPVDKQWQVENNGTCTGSCYRLKFIAGADSGTAGTVFTRRARGSQPSASPFSTGGAGHVSWRMAGIFSSGRAVWDPISSRLGPGGAVNY